MTVDWIASIAVAAVVSIVVATVVWVAFQLTVGPIIVRRRVWMGRWPRVEPVAPESQLPAEERELEHFARSLGDKTREIQCGYWYLEWSGARYRLTWKGAVLTTWKLLWPVVAVRRALYRRRASARLRRLEVAG